MPTNITLAALQAVSSSLKSTYYVYKSNDLDAVKKALDDGRVEEAKLILSKRRVALAWSGGKEECSQHSK